VFGAAIVAGAAAAFGLNSALDTHLAQAKPQVESESILVALRALPAGAPVTVWDVGLRDWPKAMVPSSAMRVTDDLDNLIVRHPLREGQPILAVQLGRADAAAVDAVAISGF
jgi:Flp pilus assembly protein CpaB